MGLIENILKIRYAEIACHMNADRRNGNEAALNCKRIRILFRFAVSGVSDFKKCFRTVCPNDPVPPVINSVAPLNG